MNAVAFRLEKDEKEAFITIVADDSCFVKEIRDDILKSGDGFKYHQGNLLRISKPDAWLPEDCK